MPYANNQGIQIHYRVEGQGPPLVLQHGSASNLHEWYENDYVESLVADYQLILIDARGHGASDKPHERAAYSLPARVNDVVAVIDDLGIEQVSYWGYSMGGWIGFGLARFAAPRLRALVLGGTHPYADRADAFNDIDGSDPDAFIAAMERFVNLKFTGADRAQLLQNDLRALAAAMHHRDSLEAILPAMSMPCLLYAGEDDPRISRVRSSATQIPNARFVSIPGLDHAQAMNRSDLILPQAMRFLQATVKDLPGN